MADGPKDNFVAPPPAYDLEIYLVDEAAITARHAITFHNRFYPLAVFHFLIGHAPKNLVLACPLSSVFVPNTMPKKKSVKFTVFKSKKDGGFFCRVTHGSSEITFFTENHKNHVDVADMLMSHIEAIQEGRFVIMDDHIGEVCTGKKCRAKKK